MLVASPFALLLMAAPAPAVPLLAAVTPALPDCARLPLTAAELLSPGTLAANDISVPCSSELDCPQL
jgi:hypothetical protein